jgi:hypothetical protein
MKPRVVLRTRAPRAGVVNCLYKNAVQRSAGSRRGPSIAKNPVGPLLERVRQVLEGCREERIVLARVVVEEHVGCRRRSGSVGVDLVAVIDRHDARVEYASNGIDVEEHEVTADVIGAFGRGASATRDVGLDAPVLE